jgi:hypothetical protein
LLAKASGQSISSSLSHRHREQAHSHSFGVTSKRPPAHRPVGAGLLAKVSGQSISSSLSHRNREQAHSHRFCVGLNMPVGTPTCRSRLAGEVVGSVDIIVADPPPSRASSLLQFLRRPQRARLQGIHRSVGAGLLAKASAQSISSSLTHRHREQAHSYSFCVGLNMPVGTPTCRSRLAGEGVESVDIIVADPPPSRASSLPLFSRRPQHARRHTDL